MLLVTVSLHTFDHIERIKAKTRIVSRTTIRRKEKNCTLVAFTFSLFSLTSELFDKKKRNIPKE